MYIIDYARCMINAWSRIWAPVAAANRGRLLRKSGVYLALYLIIQSGCGLCRDHRNWIPVLDVLPSVNKVSIRKEYHSNRDAGPDMHYSVFPTLALRSIVDHRYCWAIAHFIYISFRNRIDALDALIASISVFFHSSTWPTTRNTLINLRVLIFHPPPLFYNIHPPETKFGCILQLIWNQHMKTMLIGFTHHHSHYNTATFKMMHEKLMEFNNFFEVRYP